MTTTTEAWDSAATGRRAWLAVAAALVLALGAAFGEGLAGRAAIDGARLHRDALYDLPIPRVYHPDASTPLAFQPWDDFAARCWRAGELPLWQPHNGFGQPLLGNGQAAVFNPFKVFLLGGAAGHPLAQAWFLVSRLAFAMAGCLLLAHRLGLSAAAGGLVALAFGFHGFALANLDFAQVHAAVFLPWLAWAGEGVVRRPDARRAAIFGLLIALTGLAGHAEPALYGAAGAGLAAALAAGTHAARARLAAALAGAAALGAAGAAIAVLPFAEFVKAGSSYLLDRDRSYMASAGTLWDFPTVCWLLRRHLFAPDVGPMPPHFNLHVGLVAPCLAIAGLGFTPLARVAGALGGLGAALLVACPPASAFGPIPGAPNSFYAIPLVALAIGLLGGAGLDRLLARPRGPAWLAAGLAAAALAWLAWRAQALAAAHAATPGVWLHLAGYTGVGNLVFATGAAALAVILLVGWRFPVGRGWLAPLLVGASACNMVFAARALVPPLPAFTYGPTPITEALRAAPGPVRVASGQGAFPAATNLPHGIDHLGVLEAFFIARYHLYDAALHPDRAYIDSQRPLLPGFRPALLDLANVGFVVTAGVPPGPPGLEAKLAADPARFVPVVRQAKATLWRNTRVLPRARVLYRAEHLPVDAVAAATRLGQDPARWRDVALVEAPAPAGWRDAPLPPSPATLRADGPHALHVAAEAVRPGWLVVSEAYYPGWEATLDGAPVAIAPADVAFRGVFLPAGRHEVVFRYRPRSVAIGGAISLLAWGLGLWLIARRRPRVVSAG